MNKIKKTTVECNSLESFLKVYDFKVNIETIQNALHLKYETTVIEFWQLVDFLQEHKIKPTTPRDETIFYEDQLMDYPVAIYS